MLYSATEGINPQVSFKISNNTALVNTSNTVHIGSFFNIESSNLNPNYFNIDTTRPYKVMSLEEIKK